MLLGKQSDVKKHLSALRHTKIPLIPAVDSPDSTDTSLAGPSAITAKSTAFARDYSAEHTALGQSGPPAADSTGFTGAQSPPAPKSAQA